MTHMRASTRCAGFATLGPVAAALAAGLYVGSPLTAGFPLDDAWIHMVYGAALRDEGALNYNVGRAATGCTAPLWAMLDGAAHALASSTPGVVAWVKVFGLATHAASSLLAAGLAWACAPRRRLRVWCGVTAGLLVATTPTLAFAAVSGMEVSLTCALLTGAFLAASRDAHRSAAALAGVAVSARPECILAVPVVLAWTAWRARSARATVGPLASAAAPIALLTARTWAASGRPLPATFYAKASFASRGVFVGLRDAALTLRHAAPPSFALLVPFVVAGIAMGVCAVWRSLRARHRLCHGADPWILAGGVSLFGATYLVGSALTMHSSIPEHFYFQRYLLPALPPLIVGAVVSMAGLLDAITRRHRRDAHLRWLLGLFVAVAVAGSLTRFPAARRTYREAVANVDAVQVAVGRWVGANTRADAVVWSVDAGAVRYWGRRRTVDIMGLNTPELIAGKRVPVAWAADALVVVPTYFMPVGAPARLALAVRLRTPYPDYTARRGPYTQVIFRCVENAPTTLRDELFVVDRVSRALYAAGFCRRR